MGRHLGEPGKRQSAHRWYLPKRRVPRPRCVTIARGATFRDRAGPPVPRCTIVHVASWHRLKQLRSASLEPAPTSCPCTTWWITGLGLSGPAVVLIGIDIVARRPDRTRPAAARTVSGVM